MTGVFITLLLFQALSPVVSAEEHEIAYDNGIAGASVSLPYLERQWVGGREEVQSGQYVWNGNTMLAVRFTPDSEVRLLLGVRAYITGDLQSFNVWLFTSQRLFMEHVEQVGPPGGSSIISSVYRWTVTPVAIGWVYINVTSMKAPIFVGGDDFYFALEFTAANKPSLGVDISGERRDRSWFVNNQSANGWIGYSEYARQQGLAEGNLMIRAVTASLTQTTTSTTNTGNSLVSGEIPTLVALAILVIAAIGLWKIRRRR